MMDELCERKPPGELWRSGAESSSLHSWGGEMKLLIAEDMIREHTVPCFGEGMDLMTPGYPHLYASMKKVRIQWYLARRQPHKMTNLHDDEVL